MESFGRDYFVKNKNQRVYWPVSNLEKIKSLLVIWLKKCIKEDQLVLTIYDLLEKDT